MKKRKGIIAICALIIVTALPLAALSESAQAETADVTETTEQSTAAQTVKGVRGRWGSATGIDTSALTEEQKAVYESALALYRGVEDEVLADLVGAGAITQAQVDEYKAQRAALDVYEEIDKSSWTAQQHKAYYEARALTGTERDEALDALVTSGQLTQAQADAMKSTGSDSLWQTLLTNARTNTAVQRAVSTMLQAQITFRQALSDAGIPTGRGLGIGGMYMNGLDVGKNENRRAGGGIPWTGNARGGRGMGR